MYYTVTIDGTKETRSAPIFTNAQAAGDACIKQNNKAQNMELKARYQVTEAEKDWICGNEKVKTS